MAAANVVTRLSSFSVKSRGRRARSRRLAAAMVLPAASVTPAVFKSECCPRGRNVLPGAVADRQDSAGRERQSIATGVDANRRVHRANSEGIGIAIVDRTRRRRGDRRKSLAGSSSVNGPAPSSSRPVPRIVADCVTAPPACSVSFVSGCESPTVPSNVIVPVATSRAGKSHSLHCRLTSPWRRRRCSGR